MKVCALCGTQENLQTHHISYEPEITQVLCVRCHKGVHGHGVGKSTNCPMFGKLKEEFLLLSEGGEKSRMFVAENLGISYMTAYLWDKKLGIRRRSFAKRNGKKMTTIQISERTRDKLKLMGNKNDSYEDVLWGLLDFQSACSTQHTDATALATGLANCEGGKPN